MDYVSNLQMGASISSYQFTVLPSTLIKNLTPDFHSLCLETAMSSLQHWTFQRNISNKLEKKI